MATTKVLDEHEKKNKAVEKALGEPFGLDFSEAVTRMRTHLLVAAVISIGAVLLEVKIKADAPMLGIQFEGLTERKILLALISINGYLLVHFFWSSLDVLREWRLRRTGTMVAYVNEASKGFWSNDALDFSDDARQSTLYAWWKFKAYRLIDIPSAIAKADENITTMMNGVMLVLNKGQTPELANWQTTFMGIRQELTAVTDALKDAKSALESERIPVSLARFDSSFRALLSSQNSRWLILEWIFPLLLGICAIVYLTSRLLSIQ